MNEDTSFPEFLLGNKVKKFNAVKFLNILREQFNIEQLKKYSNDIVGFVPSHPSPSEAVYIPLGEAIDILETHGGYINGWEYVASGEFFFDFDFIQDSFLPKLGTGGRMLDSVMKWVFISKGPSTGSEWHIDPIGSCAWMIQVYGTKEWFFDIGGEIFSVTLNPGDLLYVPSGIRHRVENKGSEFNLAVSHNWIEAGSQSENNMWGLVGKVFQEVFKGEDKSKESILAHIEEHYDNIMFGLIMVLLHMPQDEVSKWVPKNILCYLEKIS